MRSGTKSPDVLAPLGLRLSAAKSRVCHLDEGLDFLGFHIQRRRKRGTAKRYVYTYPSKKALLSITAKVRALTNRSRHQTLTDLLRQLNWTLRGWCTYFRHGVSARTLPLPGPVRLAAGHPVAAPTHTKGSTGRAPLPSVLTGRGPQKRGTGAVLPPEGGGHPLPLAREQHPITMAERRGRTYRIASGNPWSAGCAETGTSGAEGGPGKRAGRDPGTAPRSDPYNAKLCINGNEWAKRQAAKAGIGFTALDNGFADCDDPARLQSICDRLTPAKIDALLRKWLRRLPHPFTPADRAAGYRYDISILQAEFSLTQMLDRPVSGRVLFEEVIRENLDLGRPDKVGLIFARQVRRRGKRPTPGRWRTRVLTQGVTPSLHVDYKHSKIKQYHNCDTRSHVASGLADRRAD